jgi:uncharacterized protein
MAQTLRFAAMGANSAKSDSLVDVAGSIAIYSLKGAQGNSGVILSQYFRGVAEYIGSRKRLYVEDVPGTFLAGSNFAYKAVKEPREGTILTVLREIAENAQKSMNRRRSLSQLIESAVEQGKITLIATKTKLKTLSDADVVDAGGQGFVHFMEGIHHLINKGEIEGKIPIETNDEAMPKMIEEHSRFRYCSEFLIKGWNFDLDTIKNRLENDGDSLIVASTALGGESYLRIHIHTDSPDNVEKLASSLGTLEKRKIEDMSAQNKSLMKWLSRPKKSSVQTVKIVTDSTSDLPAELAAIYDVEVVPLKVAFGTETYLDGVTLDNHSFYDKLSYSAITPKTSQPAPIDFTSRYMEILDRTDNQQILSIHLSTKLSGTFNSSTNAAKEFGKTVVSYDSGTISLGLSLMVLAAAEMARDGAKLDQIIKRLDYFRKNQGLVFTLENLEYVIKGGRIGKARGFVGNLLGLKPVLSLVKGDVIAVAKVRGEERVLDKIVSLLPKENDNMHWAVAHANCPYKVDLATGILRERFGAHDILTGEIGPTVGTHTGPGTWGIFYMKG